MLEISIIVSSTAACNGSKCHAHGLSSYNRDTAIGKHGPIAGTERFILTLKCLLRCLLLIPYGREAMLRGVQATIDWYNKYRPHMRLVGRTPDEAYFNDFPAHRKPGLAPRPNWPRHSPCAPWGTDRDRSNFLPWSQRPAHRETETPLQTARRVLSHRLSSHADPVERKN